MTDTVDPDAVRARILERCWDGSGSGSAAVLARRYPDLFPSSESVHDLADRLQPRD